jgi:hypothetical protein
MSLLYEQVLVSFEYSLSDKSNSSGKAEHEGSL